MSFSFRTILCLLTLSTTQFVVAQSPATQDSTPSAELVAVLVRAKSADEQERLLVQKRASLNSSVLTSLKDLSNSFVNKGDYGEALRIAQLAVRIAETVEDRLALGNALCDLGSVYGRQNKVPEALDALQKSVAVFDELGNKKDKARALHSIGYAYGLQRKYELGLEYYTKSLALSEEVGDQNLAALALNSIGLNHAALGHYELGLEYYQKSRALSEKLNDKGTLNLALNNIATLYISQGRYAEALDHLLRSLKILEDMGTAGDRRSMAYKLQNIGLVYRHQGDLDQALSYSQRSLKILQDIDDKFGIANLQNNIGVIYKSSKSYDQALDWFQKSRQGYESLKATPGIARTLNNIGDVYRLQGRYAEALEPLQRSLKLREDNHDRGGISLTLNNLSRLHESEQKYSEMLECSKRAAALAEEINGREELWDAQNNMGRALAFLEQYPEARRNFLASIATIEAMRREVAGNEQQQQSFLENKLSPWLGLVELLVKQQSYAEALSFAEQSKARVLLDALQAGRPNLRLSLSTSERKTEEEQRLKLVSLNSQYTSELRRDKSDPNKVSQLRVELEKFRLEFQAFENGLHAAHPELRMQRVESPSISAEDLRHLIPTSSTALIEYLVTDEKTYVFAVTRQSANTDVAINVYTLPVGRQHLTEQTETLRRQLANRDLGFRNTALKLYDVLVRPAQSVLNGKTNIVVVPDDTLWNLPFQTLVNDHNRFMIEDAAISYAPSLTVLREVTDRRTKRAPVSGPARLLALGNPAIERGTLRTSFTQRNESFESLPEAEQEVKTLGRLYGTTASKVLIGNDAREDRVKSDAGSARILHFATHGVLNDASPMYSYLALAKGGANEDGQLEAWELMQLNLHADLAVLSACETARGHIGAGEGMIGLSWAMFIAGVPSVVVSQWKVESASTRELMVNFHRGLIGSDGAARVVNSKSEALRQAALKLMRNPQTSHPFYWAGFVLIGDPM